MVVVQLYRDTEINTSISNNPCNKCEKCPPPPTCVDELTTDVCASKKTNGYCKSTSLSNNQCKKTCDKCETPSPCTAAKEQCSVCNSIITYIKNNFSSEYTTFKKEYNTVYSTESNAIESLLVAQNNKKTEIRQVKNTIAQLKSRLDLKSKVLAAYPSKIETLMENLNSNISRNKLSSVDKVNIGLPYLPPFFSLLTNQYIIGVSALTIILLIFLIIYAFTDLLGKKPLS